MIEKGKIFPKEVIDYWPEVFGEVKLNVMPLRYLHAVMVNFNDGRIWEIKITTKTKNQGWQAFEKTLSELFKAYDEKIKDIDFKLDTEKIKKDMQKETKSFLKKRKL
jgi:hypothetical protein